MNEYILAFNKYAVFAGRATRREYWMFFLFNIIVVIVLTILDNLLWKGSGWLSSLYGLALICPSLAVATRRLHDTDRSGWWILISLIPFIGTIILLVFLALKGTPDSNKYGAKPELKKIG
jgi:uncharacterized membrane protein YhaH (DUF805 family)